MKGIRTIIILSVYSIFLYGTSVRAQTGISLAHAEVNAKEYTYLKIKLPLNLDSLHLGRKQSRVLTPVLSDGKNTRALLPVIVNGKWRQLMYLREQGKQQEGYVLEYGKHRIDNIEYNDSCLYQPWMKNAKLWLAEDLCGCGGEPMEQSLRLLADKVNVKEKEKEKVTFMASQTEKASKLAEEEGKHEVAKVILHLDYLNFPINRMDILPDFGNNRKELRKLQTAMDSLLTLPGHHIELVEMTGYASPDGPYLRNSELAYGRTLALRDYLQKITRYRELPFRTASVAEDWEGLKWALENSDIPYKEELLMIIGTELPPDKKEENMKKLDGGKVYPILKQSFLPRLRRTICEIHYINKRK